MAPADNNPVQVQYFAKGKKQAEQHDGLSPTPLVIIHDGGGTTFAYFSIGRLQRDVWAIHSPTFATAQPWESGMDGMARHYIDLIEGVAGLKGKILLGGWSLGGYVALAMSHIIASSADSFGISVEGMLLMDSPWLVPGRDLPVGTPQPVLNDIPNLVRKSLDNCERMLYQWELPQWGEGNKKGAKFSLKGFKHTIPSDFVLYRDLKGAWRPVGHSEQHKLDEMAAPAMPATKPPPTVMLRCVDLAPTKGSSSTPCRVDQFRVEPLLGWDGKYNSDMIRVVLEASSHHYDMFHMRHVKEVTETIRDAIEILENLTADDS